MIESFLITLREGIEAALIIGILLVVVQKSGRHNLKRPIFWGLGLAILASVGVAILLKNLPINEEAYEGVLYWVSGIFVASMMVWMHRQAKNLKRDITGRVEQAVDSSALKPLGREVWGLGIFAFLMVFREGAETVMFIFAISLNSDPILSSIGLIAGLIVAVVFCVMFVNGSLNINLRKFFGITGWILGIFIFQLFISGYYEFVEAGVFTEYASIMSFVKPIHKGSSIITMIIVLAAVLVWFLGYDKVEIDRSGISPDELKHLLSIQKRQNFIRIGTLASALLILIALSVYFVSYKLPEIMPG